MLHYVNQGMCRANCHKIIKLSGEACYDIQSTTLLLAVDSVSFVKQIAAAAATTAATTAAAAAAATATAAAAAAVQCFPLISLFADSSIYLYLHPSFPLSVCLTGTDSSGALQEFASEKEEISNVHGTCIFFHHFFFFFMCASA